MKRYSSDELFIMAVSVIGVVLTGLLLARLVTVGPL